jgi:hypothetical protein
VRQRRNYVNKPDEEVTQITDLQALCAVWKVDEEEAIRRSAHLVRELVDLAKSGGEIVLKGQWQRSFLGLMKKRRVELIRFVYTDHPEPNG